MKKLILIIFTVASAFLIPTIINAQTAGTLTVVYTPTVPSTATFYSGTRHLGAAWITTSANAFVKTKIKYCGTECGNHMSNTTTAGGSPVSPWQTSSGGSTVGADVVSGATKTTFTALTFTWNGTNVAGAIVADGSYNIKIQEVWNHGTTTNQTNVSTIAFIKDTTPSTLTPAATNWLKNVSIIWQPAITAGLNQLTIDAPLVTIYPNPTTGFFNINYSKTNSIKVYNTLGVMVCCEVIDLLTEGTKTINLSNFANGIYIINVANDKGSSNHKIILNK